MNFYCSELIDFSCHVKINCNVLLSAILHKVLSFSKFSIGSIPNVVLPPSPDEILMNFEYIWEAITTA